MLQGTIFQTSVILFGALATITGAVLYFQRIRLERPAVGLFNGRDIIVLFAFIVTLPFLYLVLPTPVLTGVLVLTFSSGMYIALRPLLRPRYLWPLILALMIINIVVTETLLGTRVGWQLYWTLVDVVVLISVVGVANLYVQGGMRLRHVSLFAFGLAFYDCFFTFVIPIISKLADRFEGQPLDASIGFAMGPYNANIGLGDLLVYGLFIAAAYKGFGKRGVIASFIIVSIFGALLPALAPLVIAATIRSNGIVVPAQIFFGPAAMITYFLLRRQAPERSMAEWFSVQAAAGHEPIRVTRRARARVAPNTPSAVEVGAERAG
ncbi:MAG: hypothetical protein ACRDIV_10855 [Ktedonobacteraceae bacterium]